MAYRCTRVIGKDCDGCGECALSSLGLDAEEPQRYPGDMLFRCEECGGEAEEDGYYYDVEGTILCSDCVDKLFRREAPLAGEDVER